MIHQDLLIYYVCHFYNFFVSSEMFISYEIQQRQN